VRIPDVNVLVYTSDSSSRHFDAARSWIETALSGSETVGFAIVALLGFVRIVTHPRVMAVALSPAEALDHIDEWLTQPPATIIHPGGRHLAIWRELIESSGTAGNLVTDAHLSALAIEHGATLASFDGDLHRFSGLKLDYLR
jgi:hypothetical protein